MSKTSSIYTRNQFRFVKFIITFHKSLFLQDAATAELEFIEAQNEWDLIKPLPLINSSHGGEERTADFGSSFRKVDQIALPFNEIDTYFKSLDLKDRLVS